jgi:hypothetical protein
MNGPFEEIRQNAIMMDLIGYSEGEMEIIEAELTSMEFEGDEEN